MEEDASMRRHGSDATAGPDDTTRPGILPGQTPPSEAASLLAAAPYRVDHVALTVRDLGALTRFYRDAIGLEIVRREAGAVELGAGGRVLLALRHNPAARPRDPSEAGLFHVAFLLPTRGDLGAWLAHAGRAGVRLSGASDHFVSEAVYLDDPEGNGIEVYADRPPAAWPRDEGGSLRMRNGGLDLDGLVRGAPGAWAGMPAGGCVGHVHLQVGALEAAERFYVDRLGFDVTCRYPGATFLGAGGYHHQLAVNTWNSRGAPVRTPGATGLAEVTLVAAALTDPVRRGRCQEAGLPLDEALEQQVLHDPWATRLRFVSKELAGHSS